MRDESDLQDGRTSYAVPDWLMHIRRRGILGDPDSALAPGTVCVSDLGFRYAQHLSPVFNNLNLKLHAGEMVAFVGASGCGKSTLVQLLQGLLRPTRGVLLTCGRKDSQGRLQDARVAVVSGDPMLFGGTVTGNLMMADPTANFPRLMRACQRAGAHELVMSLPAAYETEIGERGMALKPGPRQCISLARALLRDPDILVLDEGFAQSCPEWAMRLAQALNGLKGAMTVVLACRRLPPGLALDAVYHLGSSGPMKLTVHEGGSQRQAYWSRRQYPG